MIRKWRNHSFIAFHSPRPRHKILIVLFWRNLSFQRTLHVLNSSLLTRSATVTSYNLKVSHFRNSSTSSFNYVLLWRVIIWELFRKIRRFYQMSMGASGNSTKTRCRETPSMWRRRRSIPQCNVIVHSNRFWHPILMLRRPKSIGDRANQHNGEKVVISSTLLWESALFVLILFPIEINECSSRTK